MILFHVYQDGHYYPHALLEINVDRYNLHSYTLKKIFAYAFLIESGLERCETALKLTLLWL